MVLEHLVMPRAIIGPIMALGHAQLNKLNPEGETEEIRRNELCLLSNFLDAGLL